MSKKILIPLLGIFLSMPIFSASIDVAETSDGMEISFLTPPIETVRVSTEYGEFIELNSIDGNKNYISISGAPKLPVFVLPVGVPPDAEISVKYSIDWGEPKKLPVHILPAESLYWHRDELIRQDKTPHWRYYHTKAPFPDTVAQFRELGWIRSQRIGQIVICPVKYEPSTKTIQIARSVNIDVKYSQISGRYIPEGDFEPVFEKMLINYSQSSNFRLNRNLVEIPENPFAPAERWYRVALRQGGLFAITGDWLLSAGIEPQETDPNQIRVLGSQVGILPLSMDSSLPTIQEIPLLFLGDNDSIFEAGESLLVYVPGPEWWTAQEGIPYWHPSYYCDSVSIWISITGDFPESARRIESVEITDYEHTSNTGWTFVHFGEDLIYDEYEGNGWYWQTIYGQGGIYLSDPRIAEEISPNGAITIQPTSRLRTVECNDVSYSYGASPLWVDNMQPSSNSIIYKYSPDNQGDSTVYFKSVEVRYAIYLQPNEGILHFFNSEDTLGNTKYVMTDFSETPIVFDVTDITQIRRLPVDNEGANYTFIDDGEYREYYVFELSAISELPAPTVEDEFLLWDNNFDGVDYLILASEIFDTDLLEELETEQGNTAITITIESIMKEFGFGRYDPTAIRNFLCYAYNVSSSPKPQYAVFIGDGHYDYRHRLTDKPEYFPPALYASRQTDAFFATFDSDGFMEMMSGRIPIRNQSEFDNVVQKMRNYSDCAPFGEWRIRSVMVADDEYRTDGRNDNLTYTVNVSDLIQFTLPGKMFADPVYLIEYPRAPSLKKPEARDALVAKYNNGAILVNYVGHGNYHLWAHEHVLNLPGDLSSIKNNGYLPLVTAFSCDVAQFYLLGEKECISELFVRKYPNGAIATIAATAGSYPSSNQAMNQRLLTNLFTGAAIPLAGGLIAARAGLYAGHDSQYILMGDPAQILAFPYDGIYLNINPDTLVAAQWDTVSGETEIPFDGVAKIFLVAPDQMKLYESPVSGVGSCQYVVPGKILFAGAASVVDGSFQLPIFVPKNLSSTAGYRIIVYAYSEENCNNSAGALTNVFAELESDIAVEDEQGPDIAITFEVDNFHDGGIVCSPDRNLPIVVHLEDEHGISMGGQPGQGVLIQLDDEFNRVDISQNISYELDNPTRATANYSFTDVEYGGHTVCVQAWDNLGNASQLCVDLELMDCSAQIYDPIPYPNPFQDGVDITFSLAGAEAYADVTLEIFSLGGRKIFSTSKTTYKSFDWLHWDGKSSSGEPVARGVYIFVLKATLHSIDGNTEKKILRGKIVKE
ncbi:hypothetical protein DRQ33_02685 [bacterium]|nr:MAG: hypothetical protein DRQ33_02685 [bacterium]